MSGHLMANAAFVELPRIAWAKLTLRQGGAALVGQSAGQGAPTSERSMAEGTGSSREMNEAGELIARRGVELEKGTGASIRMHYRAGQPPRFAR